MYVAKSLVGLPKNSRDYAIKRDSLMLYDVQKANVLKGGAIILSNITPIAVSAVGYMTILCVICDLQDRFRFYLDSCSKKTMQKNIILRSDFSRVKKSVAEKTQKRSTSDILHFVTDMWATAA